MSIRITALQRRIKKERELLLIATEKEDKKEIHRTVTVINDCQAKLKRLR